MAESKILLQASSLQKTFYYPQQVHLLKGVDLTVHSGETVAITGLSGQGKSTLLHLLGTLENACSGNLEIGGQKVTRFNKTAIRNKHIAFVFQSFHLLEDYTALDNVLMPARIARKSIHKHSEAYKHGCELLEKVGLGERMHFHTKLLSGGEKQRVAIARALCNQPDLILADEPSGNLDQQTASSIHQLLLDYAVEKKKAIIIVTHDKHLAALCQKQYSLVNGVLNQV